MALMPRPKPRVRSNSCSVSRRSSSNGRAAEGISTGVEIWRNTGSPSCRIRWAPILTCVMFENPLLLNNDTHLQGSLPGRYGRRHARYLAFISLPRGRGNSELRREPLRQLHPPNSSGSKDRVHVAGPEAHRVLRLARAIAIRAALQIALTSTP